MSAFPFNAWTRRFRSLRDEDPLHQAAESMAVLPFSACMRRLRSLRDRDQMCLAAAREETHRKGSGLWVAPEASGVGKGGHGRGRVRHNGTQGSGGGGGGRRARKSSSPCADTGSSRTHSGAIRDGSW